MLGTEGTSQTRKTEIRDPPRKFLKKHFGDPGGSGRSLIKS